MQRCFLLLGALLLIGCGGGQPSSVSGKVTFNNRPVERGRVTFHPVKEGPAAIGLIGPGGTYVLQTGETAGLPPGEYVVTVEAREEPPKSAKGPPRLPKSLVPAHYADRTKSALRKTVQPGSNQIDLELTGRARATASAARR